MLPSPFARLFGMISASFVTANHTVNSRGKLPENGIVIRKLSFATPGLCRLIFDYCGANLALPGTFSLVTAVRFLNGQKPFLLTTAAQNIHVFRRKSPLCRSHFFEWLKTAISSNACGMSTLKSLLPQAFAVSNVHPRPRKRPPRCTLDCGFKTSESPALRGFVGGLRALATAALYLVLKSNGLRLSKNLPAKFSFSLKIVPATIAKKLPAQRCSQPLFNFSHKRPRLLSRVKMGTHSAFGEGSHTAAYTPKQGAFRMGVVSLPSKRSARSRTSPGRVSERQVLPLLGLGRRRS